jgi:glycosyltransferase involved in cell wall biosynthesis
VVHLLYAETYLRFSPWLFRVPVVGTFHQPPERLLRHLEYGDETGRVSAVVHALTKGRYRRLAAAIILAESQREVLARFVPADRIHLVPLGAATRRLIADFDAVSVPRQPDEVVTVGNWLRDWPYYFEFVRASQTTSPALRFVLVNRNLPTEWHSVARSLPNLQWRENLTDRELLEQYARASAVFLPLREATGNNAVNEAMAAGCPIVTNLSLDCAAAEAFVLVAPPAHDAMRAALHLACSYDDQKRAALRAATRKALEGLDWAETAHLTLEVYRRAVDETLG